MDCQQKIQTPFDDKTNSVVNGGAAASGADKTEEKTDDITGLVDKCNCQVEFEKELGTINL